MMDQQRLDKHFRDNRRSRLVLLLAIIVLSALGIVWALHNLEIL